MESVTFQEVLEIIETLPEEQRESIIEIVRHRLIEERRERLAQRIREAREEYNRGEVNQGTVDDFMHELSECER